MTDRRRIEYVTTMDSKGFESGSRGLTGAVERIGQRFGLADGAIQGAVGALGAFGAAFGASQVAQWVGNGLSLAASAVEVESKFKAVYGAAEDLRTKLREWGDQAGVTEQDALNLGASFGNLAIAQGMSKDETELLVGKVAELAGDLASFNDADPEAVFEDLNKALLTTEREGLKKYGLAISENEVKHRAMELAIADGRSEVAQADRVMAAYMIAVEQAGKAVGDLDRTSDSTKNQQRQLKASMEELQQQVGEMLLPVLDELVGMGNDLVPVLQAVGTAAGGIKSPIEGVAGAMGFLRDPMKYNIEDLGKIAEKLLGLANPLLSATGWIRDWATGSEEEFEGAAFASQQAASDMAKHQRGIREELLLTEAQTERSTEAMKGSFQDLAGGVNEYERRFMDAMANVRSELRRTYDELRDKELILRYRVEGPSGKVVSDAQSTWNQINGGPL